MHLLGQVLEVDGVHQRRGVKPDLVDDEPGELATETFDETQVELQGLPQSMHRNVIADVGATGTRHR